MFDSYFGELAPTGLGAPARRDRPGFVATVGFAPGLLDDEPPWVAPDDLPDDDDAARITLIDPHRLWAPGVVKLLAEQDLLPRRSGRPLRVHHEDADGDAAGFTAAAGSALTVVIVGPLAPDAVDRLLSGLQAAARQAPWRCAHLLLLLPHGAVWMANKVASVRWPAGLRVHCNDAVLSSASVAWQQVLAHWDAWLAGPEPAAVVKPPPLPTDPTRSRTRDCLAELLQIDGLLACAVVDAASGAILARESREDQPVDLDLAAAAGSEALRACRLAARAIGQRDAAVDEIMVSTGARLQLLRSSAHNAGLFVFALLDRQRADLALARARLIDAEARLSN